jgi:hypothetical protein
VEASVLFENEHEADSQELREEIHRMVSEADDDKIKLLYRVTKCFLS